MAARLVLFVAVLCGVLAGEPGSGDTGRPKYNSLGGSDGVQPLVPLENIIPEQAKTFYRTLDKEYIKAAKKVIGEIDCCHPDSAGGPNSLQEELRCPHTYPNVPSKVVNESTGEVLRNPSDCSCRMGGARSRARFEISSAALVGFYKELSYNLDLEGSFQAGMAKALKNFAVNAKGSFAELKIQGKKVPIPEGIMDDNAFLQVADDWDALEVNHTAFLELAAQHTRMNLTAQIHASAKKAEASAKLAASTKKYIPSDRPGIEWFKDLRAMEKTYKATRDLHIRAYKRVVLSNRPFMSSVEAYIQVVKRYNSEIRRMFEMHLRLGMQGEPLVRAGWQAQNPEYGAPPMGYVAFLKYLFERYDIQEMPDRDSMQDTREAEYDADGLPEDAFHTQSADNQDKDGQYMSMEEDFSKVYKMFRNKFLKCAIDLREVIPAIEATFSALLPLDYGAPLLNEYMFLGPGYCLKERGPPTFDDSADARERGYTGPLDKYYVRPTSIYTDMPKREDCEDKCSNMHLQVLQANNPAGQANVQNGDVPETFNIEGIESFHTVANEIGSVQQVQKYCAQACDEQKDAGCSSAHVPNVHRDSPEGTPIIEEGQPNIYNEYFLDAKNMDDCKQYCYGSYRHTKGPHKGKIVTQHGCYCQDAWTTKYDVGGEGPNGATIYNPVGIHEMGNEGVMMCSEMGNHAEGREWCKVEPNCEAFKGNEGSEGGKLRRLHSDLSDGAKFGNNNDPFIWDNDNFAGQWDYCVKFSEPAFEDSYGNNLCLRGDDWGSWHIPGGGAGGSNDGEQPPEAEWQSWHGTKTTKAADWEACQTVCDKIGTYPEGDLLWVHPRLRCSNFYFAEDAPEEVRCRIELGGPMCKINLFNCQTFMAGCNGYEYNSEYSICRVFPPDDGKYHKDPNLPGYGRPGSSEGINEVMTWDGMDCMGIYQTIAPRGLAKTVEDYKDPWVKTLWYPETCPFDEQAREDYAALFMDQEVGGGPSCMKCKYEIPFGPQTDNYYDPYLKEYKDVIEKEIRLYEDGENPYFVHPHAEFEREFFKWECWRRESIDYKKDLWYDKLETGYHVWEWPGHSKHDPQEVDEITEAQDDELWNDIQEYKFDVIEHTKTCEELVEAYENCVRVVSPELKLYTIAPHVPALEAGTANGRVRSAGLKDFDHFMDQLCQGGAGGYMCGDHGSICELARKVEIEYDIRNNLQKVLKAAQGQLSAGSQAEYKDHEEAWIKPKLREAANSLGCVDKLIQEYESTSRSYMSFLKSETEEAAQSKDRWYTRVKDLIEKWNGASTGLIESKVVSRIHAPYVQVHKQAESEMSELPGEEVRTASIGSMLSETAAIVGHSDHLDKVQPIYGDRHEAKRQTLLQMTKRVDENAFRIVDFAAIYIETRNNHLRAVNDLVLSMGPYLTALKAYSVALKSYAEATEEKATHILAMRDQARFEKTVNDARAIVAFNDLKGGNTMKPHDYFSDDDPKGMHNYANAYFKQKALEREMRDNYLLDIKTGHYQTLGNKLPNSPDGQQRQDLFFAFAPYFLDFPPEHWMMKNALELDGDIMIDLVERDYETNKELYTECTASISKHIQGFRKALNAAQVMPAAGL